MPIQVTCPSCLKRFQVSEKFAGKTGPCPSCKKPLRVPDVTEEVVIHAPEDDAPKDSKGRSVATPILREETDVTRKGLFITLAAIVATIVIAVVFRFSYPPGDLPVWAKILGIVALAPPLVAAGYSFVREQELDPYRGDELRNRVLILSAIFSLLWVIYAFVPAYLSDYDEAANMSWMEFGIFFCIMLGLGALASVATFELEFSNGLAHAGLYLIGVVLLALIAGVALANVPLSDPARSRPLPAPAPGQAAILNAMSPHVA